jgi:6-pyruvoyltetrahydropterin/6-carboxytetrahydropterin synthase
LREKPASKLSPDAQAMPNLEFTRRYAMAHRLIADMADKCATPHGHDEYVTVRLTPLADFRFGGANMAAPFARVKARWHGWIDGAVDHAFQLNTDDPLIGFFRAHEPARLARIMTFVGDPTTEALAVCFYLKLSAFVSADGLPFRVDSVRVQETPTNTVCFDGAGFDPSACGLPADAWPLRADMSINDF